jgi:hypothetical protein
MSAETNNKQKKILRDEISDQVRQRGVKQTDS